MYQRLSRKSKEFWRKASSWGFSRGRAYFISPRIGGTSPSPPLEMEGLEKKLINGSAAPNGLSEHRPLARLLHKVSDLAHGLMGGHLGINDPVDRFAGTLYDHGKTSATQFENTVKTASDENHRGPANASTWYTYNFGWG